VNNIVATTRLRGRTRTGVCGNAVHRDHASGAKASHPELDLVLKLLRVASDDPAEGVAGDALGA
jgi:hypothetical protein